MDKKNEIRSRKNLRQISFFICSVILMIYTFLFLWLLIVKNIGHMNRSVFVEELKKDLSDMPENNMERNKKVSSVKSTLPSLHRDLHPVYEIRARLHPKRYRIEGTVKVAFDNPKTEQILFYSTFAA